MLGILKKNKSSELPYPPRFWLLFWGVFLNRITASMLWPFITIYMYQKLGVPLTTITLMLSLQAISSVFATTVVSPFMDKFGRKGMMLFGLVSSAMVFLAMTRATTLAQWAIIITIEGIVIPIFNIGVNTMVADIIPQSRRSHAYALIRTVANAGIAIGPVIGGLLAVRSFELVFVITAIAYLILALLVFIIIPETIPMLEKTKNERSEKRGISGIINGLYGEVLRDKHFIAFLLAFFVVQMSYAHIFSLLPVYVSANFGIAENQYSLILSVNAAMVVFFQYAATKYTDRFSPYSVIMAGAFLYAIGLFSVSFGSILSHFIISMVILTVGEMLVMPTTVTVVANLAPDDMRARYLGLWALGYPIGAGIGPIVGGLLNDNVAPVAIWYGAGTLALIGVAGFFILSQVSRDKQPIIAN